MLALIACCALKQSFLSLSGDGCHGNHLIFITLSTLSAFVNRSVTMRNRVNEIIFFALVGDEHFPVIGKGTDLYFTRAARTIKLHTIIRTSKCKIRADLIAWNLFAITDRTWYIEQSGPCARQFFSPWYQSAGKGPILTFEEFIQTVLVLTINLKKKTASGNAFFWYNLSHTHTCLRWLAKYPDG